MSIFGPVFAKRDMKVSNPKAWDTSLWNLYGRLSAAGVQVNESTALTASVVYRCAKLLSSTIASFPLKLYSKSSNGGREELEDRRIVQILRRPNPKMTNFRFRQLIQSHLFMWGNSYVFVLRDNMGRITELHILRPDRMELRRLTENGEVVYIYHHPKYGQVPLGSKELWHVPGFGYDGVQGYSIITLARESIALNLAAEEFGARFFGQGFNPGVVIKHPMKLKPETYERLKNDLRKKFAGLGKSHKGIFLEEGMDIQQLGMNNDDAQFLETRQFQAVEFCRFAGVPPHKVFEMGRATWSNVEQMNMEWAQDDLLAWCSLWEQDLGLYFLNPSELGRIYFEHKMDAILRADTITRYQAYVHAVQNGIMTRNQVRSLENLNPSIEDGMDSYTVQMQMKPIEQIAKEPEPIPQQLLPGGSEEEEEQERKLAYIEDFRDRFIKRSAAKRQDIVRSFIPLYRDAAKVVVNREVNLVGRNLNKFFSARNKTGFDDWLDEFYGDLPRYVREKMQAVVLAFAEQIIGQAHIEIGQKPELTPALREFINAYLDRYSERHVSSSILQLKRLIDEWETEDLPDAIRTRLEEWSEKRPDKIANNETVRGNGAFTRQAWLLGGITTLTWVAMGTKPCPYCRALDGKVVGIENAFVDSGDFKPTGQDPMAIKGPHYHPPLHQGCECGIVAK